MKNIIITLVFVFASTIALSQNKNFQLSSHILDVSKGSPASGVTITLEKYNEQTKTWSFIDEKVTDKNGRITDFLSTAKNNTGIYKLTYLIEEYFKQNKNRKFLSIYCCCIPN